jgi:regulatory protein YycI of two-component signal transduction system YycFG
MELLKLIFIAIFFLIVNLSLSIFIFVKYKSKDNYQNNQKDEIESPEKNEEDSIYISGSMLSGGPILQD